MNHAPPVQIRYLGGPSRRWLAKVPECGSLVYCPLGNLEGCVIANFYIGAMHKAADGRGVVCENVKNAKAELLYPANL